MNEVVKFLQENPVQYLATVGRDGRAKCQHGGQGNVHRQPHRQGSVRRGHEPHLRGVLPEKCARRHIRFLRQPAEGVRHINKPPLQTMFAGV